MSIASKITSITNHIEADYEALENLGVTNENKNIENIASCLNDLYDNIPKTTGESSNLSLTTLKGKMNLGLKGDTSQYTTNGYQLFQGISYSVSTGDIAFTYELNGGIKAVGTATANAYSMTTGNSSPYRFNLASGNYIVSGGSDSVRVQVINSSGTTLANDTGSNATFTLSETTSVYLRIEVRNGTSVNTTYYPMLEKGSTAHNWEKYTGNTASPNPTYPQNIEVVTGTQEVKVENVNLAPLDQANFTTTYYEQSVEITNQKIKISGSANDVYSIMVGKNGLVTPTSTDRITFNLGSGTYKYTQFSSGSDYSNINVRLKDENTNTMYSTGSSITLTETHTFSINLYVADTNSKNAEITIQLEKGSSATTYTPHQEQTQIVELSSKNLFDKDNVINAYLNTSGEPITNSTFRVSDYINIANTTNITISGNSGSSEFNCFYDSNKTFISGFGTGTSTTLTYAIPTNAKYIRVTCKATSLNEYQLEKGSSPTTYEAYWSIELCKIGTYQDYLYKSGDKWYKKENIYKYKFTGSETYSTWTSNRVTIAIPDNYQKVSNSTTALLLCTHYKPTTRTDIISSNKSITFYSSSDTLMGTIVNDSDHNTAELLKTFMTNNNVYMYYVLATPNDIEITNTTLIEQLDNLEKMKSYNGVTNISSNGNLPFIISASALKGE